MGGVREPSGGDNFPADTNSLAVHCRTPTAALPTFPIAPARRRQPAGRSARPSLGPRSSRPPHNSDHSASPTATLLHSCILSYPPEPTCHALLGELLGRLGRLSSKSSGPANRNGTITKMACLFSYHIVNRALLSVLPLMLQVAGYSSPGSVSR